MVILAVLPLCYRSREISPWLNRRFEWTAHAIKAYGYTYETHKHQSPGEPALAQLSEKTGATVSELIRRAIDEYLKKRQ